MDTIQKERVERDRFRQALDIKMKWKEEWEGYCGRTEDIHMPYEYFPPLDSLVSGTIPIL